MMRSLHQKEIADVSGERTLNTAGIILKLLTAVYNEIN